MNYADVLTKAYNIFFLLYLFLMIFWQSRLIGLSRFLKMIDTQHSAINIFWCRIKSTITISSFRLAGEYKNKRGWWPMPSCTDSTTRDNS
jgi:hypothetical protein